MKKDNENNYHFFCGGEAGSGPVWQKNKKSSVNPIFHGEKEEKKVSKGFRTKGLLSDAIKE